MKSFAKINLTLDVLGKREDGFHELETVYQLIDLHDDIEIELLEEDKIILECSDKDLENFDNLCYKAALLLKRKYDVKKGVKIVLKKRIPVGAGLSGGSSNAAATLRGLNETWNLNLSVDDLLSLGSELGMDVPVHLLGGTVLGTGRGDVVRKVKEFPEHYVVVVFPGFSVNTKEAYGELDREKIGKKESSKKFLESYDLQFLHNDFEFSILKKYPQLKKIREELGDHSLLSGSGSCVFGLYKNKEDAEKVYNNLSEEFTCYLSKTL